MNKKILALILALLMVVPFLASCGDDSSNKNSGGSSSTVKPDQPQDPITTYVKDLASQYNFEGATFNIIGSPKTIYPETAEVTGNLENDALYSRVRDIEDIFGIKVTFRESVGIDAGFDNTGAETTHVVTQDQMSGLASYDLVEGNLGTCGSQLLNAGALQPVNDFDMLNLSESWWLNDLEACFSIDNKLYFLTGKINPSHYSDAACILYNKEVAEKFNLPDMYEIVENGEWTVDKMNEIASVIPAGGDVKRYMLDAEAGISLYFGGGFTLSEKDENDYPFIPNKLSTAKTDYIDKLNSIFGDESVKFDKVPPDHADKFYDRDVFTNGEVLFWIDAAWRANDMRTFEVEFGILPIPKATVDQENYISKSSDRAVYFAKVVKDAEMTGVITEAMAALSEKHLEPAYYEKALQGRSTYDSASRDVLDIIYNSKVVDLECSYNWGKFTEVIGKACVGHNDSYVSAYDGSVRAAKTRINQLLKTIGKD